MKKIFVTLLITSTFLNAKIELLDRIAIIVDDGVVMESQIKDAMKTLEQRYLDQNMQIPPKEAVLNQVKEQLIIEELQLQLADRAGVKISDAELNSTVTRLASNNQMTLEEFISLTNNPWEQKFFAVLRDLDNQIGRLKVISLKKYIRNTIIHCIKG